MTFRLCFWAMSPIASTSQALPNTCTGTMARVCGVIFASMFSGARHHVSGSMSANTGWMPSHFRELAVAMKVNGVVTASAAVSVYRLVNAQGTIGNLQRKRAIGYQ